MRIVPQPDQHPNRCAVLPQVGHDHPEGYVDTGQDLPIGPRDPHIYVSVIAVEQLAHAVGYPTRGEHEAQRLLIDALLTQVSDLEAEIDSLREFERAAVYSLEHVGQKVRKKPEPEPEPKEEEVAA